MRAVFATAFLAFVTGFALAFNLFCAATFLPADFAAASRPAEPSEAVLLHQDGKGCRRGAAGRGDVLA